MAIHQVPLADATPDQLRDFATKFLNLPLEDGESDSAILAKIQAAQPGSTLIFVNEPDTPEEAAATETAEVELRPEEQIGRSTGTLGEGDPRAVIFIPISEMPGGSGDVFVGVNGRAWQLKRGHDLNVPWRVVVALQNAEATIVEHSQEEGSVGDVIERNALRYPFHFKQQPPQADIDAWHERVKDMFCA